MWVLTESGGKVVSFMLETLALCVITAQITGGFGWLDRGSRWAIEPEGSKEQFPPQIEMFILLPIGEYCDAKFKEILLFFFFFF